MREAEAVEARQMATAGHDAVLADHETRFAHEFVRPAHIIEAVRRCVLARRKGYIVLEGPLGAGKSFALHGLAAEGLDAAPVLAVVLPQDEQLGRDDFLRLLAAEARARWGVPLELPRFRFLGGSATPFAEFLHRLMRAAGLERLVLSIDGFDDPQVASAAVSGCLPPAHVLPDGCFVVFTLGPEPVELLGEVAARLRTSTAPLPGGPSGERETPCYETVALSAESAGQRAAIRTYLEGQLPNGVRAPEHVEVVLEHCGGIFLDAYLLCRALRDGLFSGDDLPSTQEVLPALLARLRQRVGREAFDAGHLQLLALLAATRRPVTAAQLVRWGVPAEALAAVLADLRFLLATVGGEALPRYAFMHGAVTARLLTDPGLQPAVVEAHRRIARAGLEDILSGTPTPDPYGVEQVYYHAGIVEEEDEDDELVDTLDANEEAYFRASLRVAASARAAGELRLARTLYDDLCEGLELGIGEKPALRPLYAEALEGAATCNAELGEYMQAVLYMDVAEYPEGRGMAATASDGDPALVREHAALFLQAAEQNLSEGMDEDAAEHFTQAVNRYARLHAAGELPLEPLVRARLRASDAFEELFDDARAGEQVELAIGELERAGQPAALASVLAELYRRRGERLADEDQHAAALDAFDAAIATARAAPGDANPAPLVVAAEALRDRADPLGALDRHDEELACFEEAVELLRPAAETAGGAYAAELALALGALGPRLADHDRAGEALAPVDEAIAVATRLAETEPSAGNVTQLGLIWQAKQQVFALRGDLEGEIRALDEGSDALRELSVRGFPGALAMWSVLQLAAAEELLTAGRPAEALPRVELSISLRERGAADEGRGVERALLPARVLRAQVLARLHGPEEGLRVLDTALEQYNSSFRLLDDTNPFALQQALEVKVELLEQAGRRTEAAQLRRNNARMANLLGAGLGSQPAGEEIVPGVFLASAGGTTTLTLTDAETGVAGTSVFLDHRAIATLRADLRGWSGTNWLSPDRDLQVRSRGKHLELTAHPGGDETRRTLSPDEAASFRERINALYEEGRAR